jgi:hypothetical protein
MSTTYTRQLERLVSGIATQDGAGVSLTRVLTHDLQRRLSLRRAVRLSGRFSRPSASRL